MCYNYYIKKFKEIAQLYAEYTIATLEEKGIVYLDGWGSISPSLELSATIRDYKDDIPIFHCSSPMRLYSSLK